MKILVHTTLLLYSVILFSQEMNTLDTLEKKLSELKNRDPDETIRIGTYILRHSPSDRQKSSTLAFMSFAYFAKKDAQKSTELLFRSKEIADQTKDPEIIVKINGTIAQMYLSIGFKEKAVYHLQKAINEIRKLPDGDNKYTLKGLSYIELGKISLDEIKHNEATAYFKNSLVEFNKMDDNSLYYIKRSYFNIGDSFYGMGQLDSAQQYLQQALDIKQNPIVNHYALYTLSNIYNQKKQYQRAIDTLVVILENDKLDDELKSEIYLSISKNHNALGNSEKYNLFNEKHLALNKEIIDNNLSTIKNAITIEEKNLIDKINSADDQNSILILVMILICCIGTALPLYLRQKKKMQYEAVIDLLEKRAEPIAFPKVSLPLNEVASQYISPETEHGILEKLIKFEQSGKFTNSKLTISTVAVQLKTNTTYLSQIINKYKEKNFNAYINELRINYICERIHSNPECLTYKISYLGEIAGFTSHSTFTTIFKSVTGISPSAFLKEAEKSRKQN